MKKRGRIIFSLLAACAGFLFLFFGMGWNPVIAGGISVAAYVGLILVSAPGKIKPLQEKAESLENLLEEARKDLKRMTGCFSRIADQQVKAEAGKLYKTGQHIYEYLREHPKKIGLAKEFFLYYLDMSAGILEKYVEFQETELETPEVREILKKTADALPVLNTAFEKQYTRLMTGDMMNVEADITVLNNKMKMEGLE